MDNPKRIELHEITKEAALRAVAEPHQIDMPRVNAQQARRILDRLVGYKISPLLWAKVRGGLSAGRVQSVAVRLIVDREREIKAFIPREYWSVTARLAGTKAGAPATEFAAELVQIDGAKADVKDAATANAIVSAFRMRRGASGRSKARRRNRRAFMTSTPTGIAG